MINLQLHSYKHLKYGFEGQTCMEKSEFRSSLIQRQTLRPNSLKIGRKKMLGQMRKVTPPNAFLSILNSEIQQGRGVIVPLFASLPFHFSPNPNNALESFFHSANAIGLITYFQAMPFAASVAMYGLSLLLFLSYIQGFISTKNNEYPELPSVPEVPGLPLIGNLLQLKEKKPHKTFLKWAETYGPIYSIRTGVSSIVVLNSMEVAKEAMVTRYSSISTRRLPTALRSLTRDKCMVATSDYNDFHKTVKRYILENVLGPNAQKQNRCHRDYMIENLSTKLNTYARNNPLRAVNFREVFASELFGLALKQALGKDVQSIYVEELGTDFSRDDIFKVLVTDLMAGAIEVDWRDFFPYLKWIPNKNFETNIKHITNQRDAVMNALIREQKERIASGEKLNSYIDFLISDTEATTKLTEQQMTMLLWETIIETADTTMVTTEWAIYELAKNSQQQDRLYDEIHNICGSNNITEENLCQLPYLSAVFHETMRKHSPVPVVPVRYAHENTQVGGYFIPAGSEIAINIYGCNMDKNRWENPEEWKPERFTEGKYDTKDLYKTMAFGAGKRVCAGSLQAMLVACTSIGRLIQDFEWKLKDGEEEDVNTVGLTNQKLHPMLAIINPRK